MNILHITPWYEPSWASGGTAVSVSNICRGLVKLGNKVTVYTTLEAGEGKVLSSNGFKDSCGGVSVEYFNFGFSKLKIGGAMISFQMLNRLKTEISKFDIVHISSTRHLHGLYASYLCKKYNIPYVITPHASIMQFWVDTIGRPFIKKIYINLFDRYVLKNASSIHYLSDYEREESNKFAFNSEYIILPNGIKVPDQQENIKKENNEVRMLYVGRIHPQKNLLLIVEAMAALNNSNIYLDVVGAVDDTSYYKNVLKSIKSGNVLNVNFHGSLSKNEVEGWYQKSDILIMPSVVEGVSMAIIEAASFSLPVIISDQVGNYREIVEDNSGIVVPATKNGIMNGISTVLNNKSLLKNMAGCAYDSVLRRYDINLICKKMLEYYKKIRSDS